MKNKVRRNLRKNNKFNYRKHRGKRALKEWLKNPKPLEMHIDPNFLGMPNGVPNQEPFGMPLTYSPKIDVNVVPSPLNLQIKNGDKWEPLVGVNIEGK